MHTKEVWEDSCLTICVIAGKDGAKTRWLQNDTIHPPTIQFDCLQEISNVNDIRWGGWRMCESVCVCVCVWEGGRGGGKGRRPFLKYLYKGWSFE